MAKRKGGKKGCSFGVFYKSHGEFLDKPWGGVEFGRSELGAVCDMARRSLKSKFMVKRKVNGVWQKDKWANALFVACL